MWCREAEAVLASAGPLLARSAALPAGLLEATRVRDANTAEPSRAVVQSLEFHPDGQIIMTAGFDKRLRFFQVLLCVQSFYGKHSCSQRSCCCHCAVFRRDTLPQSVVGTKLCERGNATAALVYI
jgi:hypothetical protein